jgi:hypothetical protein
MLHEPQVPQKHYAKQKPNTNGHIHTKCPE